MAIVDELAISEEERTLWLKRCIYLVKIHRNNQYTKDVVQKVFEEWMSIATRLRKGGEMIERKQAETKGDISKMPHMIPMIHLYYFLIGMFNIYEGFFQSAFSGDQQSLYIRAYEKVKHECWGEAS